MENESKQRNENHRKNGKPEIKIKKSLAGLHSSLYIVEVQ